MKNYAYIDNQNLYMATISGDGDYFKTVNYLVSQGKFERLMLQSHKNASSLYRKLTRRYYIYLDDKTFRDKFRL